MIALSLAYSRSGSDWCTYIVGTNEQFDDFRDGSHHDLVVGIACHTKLEVC